ncbi:MAG: type II secretion system F family protein [Epulopiscium sp.]|nr:type II secretion system F family protein [Candidatus Epulonipiscium sp.]
MPIYSYKARDIKGKLITGEGDFDSEAEIRSTLVGRKLIPIEIKQKTALNTDLSKLPMFKPKVKMQEIAIFCRQFAVMLDAGISIGGTLDIMRKQVDNATLREIIQDINDEVQKGRSLSESMKEHPEFPLLLINMVEAGEVSGNLDSAMNQMAIHFEKQMKTQRQVKKALTYPVIVVVLMIVVVTGLLMFVVPSFVSMFQEASAELPGVTLALIAMSDFMRSKWYILFGIIALVVITYNRLKKIDKVRYQLDKYALNAPAFGNLNKKIITANFCRTLSTLMKAGIPIIQTMEVIKKVVQNTIAMEVLEKCIEDIKQGGSIAISLRESSLFPVMLISMVHIGEESGSLDTIMDKTADFYEGEVEVAIDQMTTMISPIITIVMGVMVGFIMLAIVMPMFSLATQI